MSDNKTLPLKIKNSDGDLQQISSAEKNFVAYLVGLQNASADSSDVGLLTTSAAGNRSLGSLTDTYYPEPVGTHPYDQASVVTTTTNLYQINGTASEADSDFRRPVAHYGSNVYEMNDTDLNTLVDDLNSRIALSDYPGSLKLSATRPSTDYDILIPNLLVDQRADSSGSAFTINEYSIWRRTSMAAPTSILDDDSAVSNIASIKRSNGDSGDYQGLQRMTDRQIQVSLGQRAKTRRAIADNIGSYSLRTASQGVPPTGTWKSVGSAVNTIRLVNEQNYTRTRVSAYTRDRSSTYTRNSTSTFSRDFIGEYTRTSTRIFTGNYTREYIGNYTGDFTGNYSRQFTGNYSRNYTGDFTGNYTRQFTGNYSRNYVRTSTRTRISTYSRTRSSSYSRNFTGNYSRGFAGNFTGEYSRNFTGDFIGNYSRNFTRTRTSSYARYRVGTGGPAPLIGAYTGDYIGTTNEYFQSYAGPSGGPFPLPVPYTQNYIGPARPANYTRVFLDYFTRVYPNCRNSAVPDPGPIGFRFTTYCDPITEYYAGNFARFFTRNFIGNYSRAFTRTVNIDYARDFTRISTNTRFSSYTRTRPSNYSRNFVGNYSRGFAGNYTGEYSRNFTRTRFSAYTRNSTSTFARNFTRTRFSAYTRNSTSTFTRTRTSAFTRDRNSSYVGNYARTRTSSYTGDFTGNYARSFAGNYSRDFVGDYIGQTIGDTIYTVETYTLYVRTA